jgi:hypothetical protein
MALMRYEHQEVSHSHTYVTCSHARRKVPAQRHIDVIADEAKADVEVLWEGFIEHLERGEQQGLTQGWQSVLKYFLERMKRLNPELGESAVVIVEAWKNGIVNLDSIR